MKRFLLLLVFLLILAIPVSAHSGRTDSNGGHTDQSTGEYHYHHGYPAHDHYDMDGDGFVDCPYEFNDKSNTAGFINKNDDYEDEYDDEYDRKTDKNKNKNTRSDPTFWQLIGAFFILSIDALIVFFAVMAILLLIIYIIAGCIGKDVPDKVSKTIAIIVIVVLVIVYGLNLFGVLPFSPILLHD